MSRNRHKKHEGFLSCDLADRCLAVVLDMEQQVKHLEVAMKSLKTLVYDEAREHVEWLAGSRCDYCGFLVDEPVPRIGCPHHAGGTFEIPPRDNLLGAPTPLKEA